MDPFQLAAIISRPLALARCEIENESSNNFLSLPHVFGCFWHALVVVLFGTRLVVVVVLQKQQLRSRDWYG